MNLRTACNIALVESLDIRVKHSIATLVAIGVTPQQIAGQTAAIHPHKPLTAMAARRFAEMCWMVRRQRGDLN